MTCMRSHPCLLGPRAKLPTHTLPRAHWPMDTPGQLTRWAHCCPRRGTNMLSGGVCWLTSWLGSCRAGDIGIPVPLSYEDTGPGRLILAGGQTLGPQIPSCLSLLHPQPRQAREPQSSHHVSPRHARRVPSLQTTALPGSKAAGSRMRGLTGGARAAFPEATGTVCGGWTCGLCASDVQTQEDAGRT